jgi:hypothetical protein
MKSREGAHCDSRETRVSSGASINWNEDDGMKETRNSGTKMELKRRVNLHKIALEEVLQLPLSCRIGQVANVEAAALSSAGRGGLVGGRLVIGRLVADGGIAQSVCDVINGSVHIGVVGVGGRHVGGWWMSLVVRLSMTFELGPVVEERSKTVTAC